MYGCFEWCEECFFELLFGVLDGLLWVQEVDVGLVFWVVSFVVVCELVFIIMYCLFIGVDKFLGQVMVVLDEVFGVGCVQYMQWYKLYFKLGKKEKECGEIEVIIQFMCNNLSVSMFDLFMKDKLRFFFSKIKDKMKGKKKYDLEFVFVIFLSSVIEDFDLGSLGKMGKVKGFFFCNKLCKLFLIQFNILLGLDSILFLVSGSLVYQGFGVEFFICLLSCSSWLFIEGGRDFVQFFKLFIYKRIYSDEVSQM